MTEWEKEWERERLNETRCRSKNLVAHLYCYPERQTPKRNSIWLFDCVLAAISSRFPRFSMSLRWKLTYRYRERPYLPRRWRRVVVVVISQTTAFLKHNCKPLRRVTCSSSKLYHTLYNRNWYNTCKHAHRYQFHASKNDVKTKTFFSRIDEFSWLDASSSRPDIFTTINCETVTNPNFSIPSEVHSMPLSSRNETHPFHIVINS